MATYKGRRVSLTPAASIGIIVAVDRDGAIGRAGDLLYHIGPDLRRFKTLTMGGTLIMGRRTFESLPGGALPGRRNIVLTRSGHTFEGAETALSIADALAMAEPGSRVWIIGGAQVYEASLPWATRLEITQIDASTPDADTFMPHWQRYMPPLSDILPDAPWRRDPRTNLRYRFIAVKK